MRFCVFRLCAYHPLWLGTGAWRCLRRAQQQNCQLLAVVGVRRMETGVRRSKPIITMEWGHCKPCPRYRSCTRKQKWESGVWMTILRYLSLASAEWSHLQLENVKSIRSASAKMSHSGAKGLVFNCGTGTQEREGHACLILVKRQLVAPRGPMAKMKPSLFGLQFCW